MAEIPRTLKTFGGVPIQIAKQGDIVRGHGQGTSIVKQAYPDGSVRCNDGGREVVLDAGAFEMVSRALEN